MIKILSWNNWKRFNIKMKQQRTKLRNQHSIILEQENEIETLRVTIIGLQAELKETEQDAISARSKCRAIQMAIEQKKVTPTNKLKEISLILE